MKTFLTLPALRVALAVTLACSGCGTLKTREKNDVAVSQIRSAAFIAFTADLPASAGVSALNQESVEAAQMFSELSAGFSKLRSWKILPLKEMQAHPAYREAYQRTMEGWQNKMPPRPGVNRFGLKGVMDFDSPRILGPEGRDGLIRSLGVDAIIVARVDVSLRGTSVMGIGARRPQSRISFSIFRPGTESPVWFDAVEGQEARESVGSTALIDEVKLAKLAVESVKSAIQRISEGIP